MMMKKLFLLAGLACAAGAGAQPGSWAAPQNVVQLSATGTQEVAQDLLTLRLSTSKEGPEAAQVQAQLKAALDAALSEARREAAPGQLDVRTGNFALYPRSNARDGRIAGWQGSAELVLEGRDFSRISQVAGRIQTLTLAGVSFSLSREARAGAETQAQTAAIARFKGRAADIAREFGFAGYALREVNVQASDPGFPRPMLARAALAATADASPVPVEAGRAAVTVTVSGSVQLK